LSGTDCLKTDGRRGVFFFVRFSYPRGVRRIAWVAVGVGSSAVACSLTTNFDGIDGVRPEGGIPESGVDAEAGASDAPVQPFCARQTHFFCADFDQGKLEQGWQQLIADPGSSGLLDTTAFVSPPGSFDAFAHADAGGNSGVVLVNKFVTTPSGLHAELDVRVDACDALSVANLLFIQPGGPYSEILLFSGSSGNAFFNELYPDGDGGTVQNSYQVGALPVGTWVHTVIDVGFSPSSSVVKVVFHPSTGSDSTLMRALGPIVPGGDILVNVGVYRPLALCRAHFDNVAFDMTP